MNAIPASPPEESKSSAAGAASPVTSEEVSHFVPRLLAEVDRAFDGPRWTLLNSGSDRVKWLSYCGAALRHCCRLLGEIEVAGRLGQELAVRVLGRAHLEAWLVCLYLHFGEYPAVQRLGQDARRDMEALQQDVDTFNEQLKTDRKEARKRRKAVQAANAGITRWNEANPDKPAKPLHEIPHLPQLAPLVIDVNQAINGFGTLAAQELSVSEIVDTLTVWGPARGFALESFRPLYVHYRLLSSVGAHAGMSILDQYLMPYQPSDWFIRVKAAPNSGSAAHDIRCTALYATASVAGYILGALGCDTAVADEIEARLHPDPQGRSAWAPGI